MPKFYTLAIKINSTVYLLESFSQAEITPLQYGIESSQGTISKLSYIHFNRAKYWSSEYLDVIFFLFPPLVIKMETYSNLPDLERTKKIFA
jgi:hypothetical protein